MDLGTVLDRASQYVAQYESVQLGNLLVREHYLQNATSFSPSRVRQEDRRDIDSDFLILQMDGDRRGIRRVDRVDGRVVKSKEPSFEEMMDDSPAAVKKRIAALIEEGTRYDIGNVLRQSNVPTFALKVVRKAEKMRFEFNKAGEEKVNGIQTWKVSFRDKDAPTLQVSLKKEPLYSYGVLWIEPVSGRILKTEVEVENPYPATRAHARAVVTYAEDKGLGILVPKEMIEKYTTDEGWVDCRASYSNFRSFAVQAKDDLPAPKTPEPRD